MENIKEMIAAQVGRILEAHSNMERAKAAAQVAEKEYQKIVAERQRLEDLLKGSSSDGQLLTVKVKYGSSGPRNPEDAFLLLKDKGAVAHSAKLVEVRDPQSAGSSQASWGGWAIVVYTI
jgi:hypothetical protein